MLDHFRDDDLIPSQIQSSTSETLNVTVKVSVPHAMRNFPTEELVKLILPINHDYEN